MWQNRSDSRVVAVSGAAAHESLLQVDQVSHAMNAVGRFERHDSDWPMHPCNLFTRETRLDANQSPTGRVKWRSKSIDWLLLNRSTKRLARKFASHRPHHPSHSTPDRVGSQNAPHAPRPHWIIPPHVQLPAGVSLALLAMPA